MKSDIKYFLRYYYDALKHTGASDDDMLNLFLTIITWRFLDESDPDFNYHIWESKHEKDFGLNFQETLKNRVDETFFKFPKESRKDDLNFIYSNHLLLNRLGRDSFLSLLKKFIDHFNKSWIESNENVITFFDELEFAFNIKNKNAFEYPTPLEIVKLLTNLLDLNKEGSLYDPYCRTGDFLYTAFYRDKINATYGLTENTLDWKIAFVKSILFYSPNSQIIRSDIYNTHSLNKTFDYVITNPPFGKKSRKIDFYDESELRWTRLFAGRWSEIDHICNALDHLNISGQAAIVVPMSILFGKEKSHFRKSLIEENLIEAVITLPEKTFSTRAKTAILVINKRRVKNSVLLVNASELGISQKDRHILSEDDINLILQIVNRSRSGMGMTDSASNIFHELGISEIRKNNYDLNYSSIGFKPDIRPSKVILSEIEDLNKELERINEKLDRFSKRKDG